MEKSRKKDRFTQEAEAITHITEVLSELNSDSCLRVLGTIKLLVNTMPKGVSFSSFCSENLEKPLDIGDNDHDSSMRK